MVGEVPLMEEEMWNTGLNAEPEDHQRFRQMTFRGISEGFIYTPLVEVVDLFCGGGGFSEGAKNAGARVVLAVDCWRPALDVHEANHPDVPTIELELGGSIQETAILIRRYLSKGAHFHLHGSPPCQAISTASNADPEEGMKLVNWFIDLVHYMKPDSWSMENVVPVAKKLDEQRPEVHWRKINSADYGVPQIRNRIFAGHGWKPKITHSKEDWISVIEALPHLMDEVPSINQIVSRRRKKNQKPQAYSPSDPAHTITQVRHIAEHIKLEALGANAKRNLDRTILRPSKTICGSGNQTGARIFDHTQPEVVKVRSLTLKEHGILQGFPEEYQWVFEKKEDAWTIIGNAVCPPVAEAVIRGIF